MYVDRDSGITSGGALWALICENQGLNHEKLVASVVNASLLTLVRAQNKNKSHYEVRIDIDSFMVLDANHNRPTKESNMSIGTYHTIWWYAGSFNSQCYAVESYEAKNDVVKPFPGVKMSA